MQTQVREDLLDHRGRQDGGDDLQLAAALAGSADLIASGDKKHVLPLGSYKGIPIVTAREAVERLGLGS